jgi:hypothetical protein
MLNLSEPFIPEKLDAKIALLEKIQAEPDSLFVYIGNSEFYDEDYSNDIDTNERFYTMVLESIREKQNSTYYLESIGPKLMDGGDYGALMSHNVMLIHTNTCYGLRLSFVRKYFKWHILTVSHVIPERICMPRISN